MTGARRTAKLVRRAAVHGCGAAFHGDLVEVAVDGGGDDAGAVEQLQRWSLQTNYR